ncbi:MAG: TMEM175 family protein [Pseudolabrys sp.]
MHKGRLEAFSDGVIAIIITIMVLELKAPHGADLAALAGTSHVFIGYVLSFVYVGIYWNNHHHMFQLVKNIDGSVLWANLYLLFWLSLFPFANAWMGDTYYAMWPVIAYGVVLLMAAAAYSILVWRLVRINAKDSPLAIAVGKDVKGNISIVIYLVSLALAFVHPYLALAGYLSTALMWLIPDKRMENAIGRK